MGRGEESDDAVRVLLKGGEGERGEGKRGRERGERERRGLVGADGETGGRREGGEKVSLCRTTIILLS